MVGVCGRGLPLALALGSGERAVLINVNKY